VAGLFPTHALTLGYSSSLESKVGSVGEGCIDLGAGGRAGLIGKGPYPQFPQTVSLVIIILKSWIKGEDVKQLPTARNTP
jgi:hypothetical protein